MFTSLPSCLPKIGDEFVALDNIVFPSVRVQQLVQCKVNQDRLTAIRNKPTCQWLNMIKAVFLVHVDLSQPGGNILTSHIPKVRTGPVASPRRKEAGQCHLVICQEGESTYTGITSSLHQLYCFSHNG